MAVDLFQTFQRRDRRAKLIRADAEIDIAVGTQRGIGIAMRDGPTLDEHGLDARSLEQRPHVSDLAFVTERR